MLEISSKKPRRDRIRNDVISSAFGTYTRHGTCGETKILVFWPSGEENSTLPTARPYKMKLEIRRGR